MACSGQVWLIVDLDWTVIFTYGLSKLDEAWSAVDLVWIMVDMVTL
jgi:hypothetical protein